ncbi:glycosyltransferase [Azospirillum brasilense]|nr:glycosyltransferase [Azospirillum brasilense]NUB30494.1 glycosyltransferase [Azospirillum brasilense]
MPAAARAAGPPAHPLVSVLMSVHRDVRFLDAAVDSLLGQTLGDFELLLVDDGSPHAERLRALAGRDRRVRLVVNDRNLGLTVSLNRAAGLARAPVIARMDADDISHPDRLTAQYERLSAQPGLTVVGSNYVAVDTGGTPLRTIRLPEEDAAIRWTALFANPFCHPATLFRAADFHAAGGYDERLACAQDYDLWMRLLRRGQGANLPEPLLRYRINDQGISATRKAEQEAAAGAIRWAQWLSCGVGDLDPERVAAPVWRLQTGVPARDPSDTLALALATLRLLDGLAARDSRNVAGLRETLAAVARRVLWTAVAALGWRLAGGWDGRRLLALAARFDAPEVAACLALGRSRAARRWAARPPDFDFACTGHAVPGAGVVPWTELSGFAGVWIYGAGEGGRAVLRVLRRLRGCRVAGFVDSVRRGGFEGLPLLSRADFLARPAAGRAVVIASGAWREILEGLGGLAGHGLFVADVEGDLRLYRVPPPPGGSGSADQDGIAAGRTGNQRVEADGCPG